MGKKVSVFLVDGFETVEALAVVDVLKRAGIGVELVSVMNQEYVTSAQDIVVKTDAVWSGYDYQDTDLFFLPGGPGTSSYEQNEEFLQMIAEMAQAGKPVAAICAAPAILGHLKLLEGKRATCFPGFEKDLYGAQVTGERVVTDGNITTAKGMGASMDLGLELVKILLDEETALDVGKRAQYL